MTTTTIDPLLNPASLTAPGPAPSLTGAGYSAGDGGPTFDPKTILHILLKRLWLVLAISVTTPTAVWLYTRSLPRQYQATASMVVDSVTPQYMGSQFREVVEVESTNWSTFKEYLETQYYVIRSRTLALRVLHGLCQRLGERGPASSLAEGTRMVLGGLDCKSDAALERTAAALQGLLSLSTPTRESRVVNVSIETVHPELAAALANGYVESFVSRNLEQRRSASGHATDWLGSEYLSLQKQLTESEENLVRFKMEHNILKVNIEDQQNRVVAQMQRYGDELQNVRLKLIAQRAIKDQYARMAQDEDPFLNVPPPIDSGQGGTAAQSTFQDLRRQYLEAFQKKVELTGRYLERHPLVVAQELRLATLRDELRRELRLSERTIKAQYDALMQQEQELRKAVDATTREALGLEAQAIEYNKLKRHFERLRQLTDRVGGRETEADLASRLNTSNVKPLDPAQVPVSPVGPNVRTAVLTALAVSLLLSIFLCFAIEFFDATVKTQDDVEQVLGVPFLGIIPHLPDAMLQERAAKGSPKELFIAEHPKSTVAECCRVIRTNLLFMSPDRPARAVLVTSAGPQEGKSMSSVSLALTMAQSGSRVLLVDTDMRRPRLHKVFGVPSGGIGITSVIAGDVAPLDAVRETGQENLFLLPCGPLPPNPAELLQTERFRQIVAELGAAFDKVIFDSPPVGAVTDPLILSQATDGVILIAKSHKTSREILRRASRQLRDLGAKMLGCVLNDLDLENRRKGYGYPYYYYYKSGYYRYGYYSSEEGKDGKPGEAGSGGAWPAELVDGEAGRARADATTASDATQQEGKV